MAHDITHGMIWQLNSGMLCWIANWIVFSYFITLSIALPIVLLPLLCIVLTDVLLSAYLRAITDYKAKYITHCICIAFYITCLMYSLIHNLI